MEKIFKENIKIFLKKIRFYNFYFFLLKKKNSIKNRCLKTFYKTAPILLYHRIDNISDDPIMLCVAPECFEKHLIFLKENYKIISLKELSYKIISKTLKGNELAITFDDGYKDNFTKALPLLEKYNVPATIFVSTKFLGQRASFKWDLEYNEEDRAFFLNEQEIKRLSDHPLVEIGAHTHNHQRLSDLDYKKQKEDILKSKNILEKITKKEIELFAYPFGGKLDFDRDSKKLVEELGFQFAYTNNGFLARGSKEKFSIPRINVREVDKCELEKILIK